MKTTLRIWSLPILLLSILVGCTSLSKSSRIKANIDGNILTITADSSKIYNLSVAIADFAQFTVTSNGNDTINLMDTLRGRIADHYQYAYSLATCKGNVEVKLNVPNRIDTAIQCTLKYNDLLGNNSQLTSGRHAKIINNLDSDKIDSELRRWAYKNNKTNIGDSLFNSMRLYLRDLSSDNMINYVTVGDIPTLQSDRVNDIPYKVTSSMKADHYFLYAAYNDSCLDDFIEEMIARNMADSKKSLDGSIHVWKRTNAWGCRCIFLIGINNDWTTQISPVGVILIDDLAPSYGLGSSYIDESYSKLEFPKRGLTIDVSSHPRTTGTWSIDTGDWQGVLPYIRVPFTLEWYGDVSKITVNRGDNNISTINLNGKTSPYHIDLTCKIAFGDNYYEIKAYDKLGNVSTIDHCISAARVTDNDDE